MTIDQDIIAAMNTWRLAQRPVPEFNQAVLLLIRRGLEAELSQPPTATPARPADAQTEKLANAMRAAAQPQPMGAVTATS